MYDVAPSCSACGGILASTVMGVSPADDLARYISRLYSTNAFGSDSAGITPLFYEVEDLPHLRTEASPTMKPRPLFVLFQGHSSYSIALGKLPI